MIEERYVNLEVAKLLRDKGFNIPVNYEYHYKITIPQFHRKKHNFNGIEYRNCSSEWYSAPTQQMACDWIEETFNINITVWASIIGYLICLCYSLKDPNTASHVIQDDIPDGDNSDGSWSNKETAYNEALKYVLTNLV